MKLIAIGILVLLAGCSSTSVRTERHISVACQLLPTGVQTCQVSETWEGGTGTAVKTKD